MLRHIFSDPGHFAQTLSKLIKVGPSGRMTRTPGKKWLECVELGHHWRRLGQFGKSNWADQPLACQLHGADVWAANERRMRGAGSERVLKRLKSYAQCSGVRSDRVWLGRGWTKYGPRMAEAKVD